MHFHKKVQCSRKSGVFNTVFKKKTWVVIRGPSWLHLTGTHIHVQHVVCVYMLSKSSASLFGQGKRYCHWHCLEKSCVCVCVCVSLNLHTDSVCRYFWCTTWIPLLTACQATCQTWRRIIISFCTLYFHQLQTKRYPTMTRACVREEKEKGRIRQLVEGA